MANHTKIGKGEVLSENRRSYIRGVPCPIRPWGGGNDDDNAIATVGTAVAVVVHSLLLL